MKKIIKFIKNNILGFLVGLSLCLNGVVIAENIITANQVTYKDSTVQTELDSLFDAVDINERLGNTDEISDIGDGTVSGAVNALNDDLSVIYTKSAKYTRFSLSSGGSVTINCPSYSSSILNIYPSANVGLNSGLYAVYSIIKIRSGVNVKGIPIVEGSNLSLSASGDTLIITNNGEYNCNVDFIGTHNYTLAE